MPDVYSEGLKKYPFERTHQVIKHLRIHMHILWLFWSRYNTILFLSHNSREQVRSKVTIFQRFS